MSRHCCYDVATLSVDDALLLRLCFDVVAMSRHWYFFVLPSLVDVTTLEIQCCNIEVNVMILSIRCCNIDHQMSRHSSINITTLLFCYTVLISSYFRLISTYFP